jgi:hypothetical protein
MGLAIAAIGFYSLLVLFLGGLLISALLGKNSKKRRKKLIILAILALPVLHFIAGKTAYEMYYKRQAGFHYQQNYNSTSFQNVRGFMIESLKDKYSFPLDILYELRLGRNKFIEVSMQSMYLFLDPESHFRGKLDLPTSDFYRIQSSTDESCYWDKNSSERLDPINLKRCFYFDPIDRPESEFGFRVETNNSIYFLPISRERTILFKTNSQMEVGRFESYRFYYFYGSVFGGRKYPYAGGSGDLEFFYEKLMRPWK